MNTLHTKFKAMLDRHYVCYAHEGHFRYGTDITNPEKKTNSGYAEQFEHPKPFAGRMAAAAKSSDLFGITRPDKPWLDYLPRIFFLSDMGDALSEEIGFEFLKTEIIDVVSNGHGCDHIYLWLTKNPKRMAEFGRHLTEQGVSWPDNLVAMTTVTSGKTIGRIKHLIDVPARFRGLSVEPLWENVTLPLDGIDWCIVGGQSGSAAKSFDLAWAESLRAQCQVSNTGFFIKQLGADPVWNGKRLHLRHPHGGDWDEWPQHLRFREIPQGFRTLRFAAMCRNPSETAHTIL